MTLPLLADLVFGAVVVVALIIATREPAGSDFLD